MLMYERNLGLLLMAKLSGFRHIGTLSVNVRCPVVLKALVETWKLKS